MAACARRSEAFSKARRGLAVLAAGAAFLLASACAGLAPPPVATALCESAGVAVRTDFPAAGQHACAVNAPGRLVVGVNHEPSALGWINPSPYYAFALDAAAPATVDITLAYGRDEHRYAPRVRTGEGAWSSLPPEAVEIGDRKAFARFRLDLAAGRTLVASHALSPADDQLAWMRSLAARHGLREAVYGQSHEGRPLVGFVFGADAPDAPAVIALTRQHPPEISGQTAFRAFVERLLERKGAAADAFRTGVKLVLAPLPNPDGVEHGHWRLNAGGVDLNRDWKEQTQPETRALAAWFRKEADGRATPVFLDFHSTQTSVIYAPDLADPRLTGPEAGPRGGGAFLAHLKARLDTVQPDAPEWSYSHNAGAGTSKAWALETLGAPGVTVELADAIAPADAQASGVIVADAVIDWLNAAR